MNRFYFAPVAVGAFLSMSAAILAEDSAVAPRAAVIRKSAACTTSYTVEVPALARVQGTAFFRTSIAFTNNTDNDVTATYQFSYTCPTVPACIAGTLYYTNPTTIPLRAFDSFVQDDFIDYMSKQGIFNSGRSNPPPDTAPGPTAEQGTIGTLLVTFANLPSCYGWEANVVARTYNRTVETDPTQGTVGFAYNASLFFESADTTLVGFAQDTQSSPTIAGKLSTNVGIRNTDVNETGQPMSVVITCYDPSTGHKVGTPKTISNLRPGELQQITDLWSTVGISPDIHSVLVFADAVSPTATSPTMEGFITIKENQFTKDAAFFEMRCADANGCGN